MANEKGGIGHFAAEGTSRPTGALTPFPTTFFISDRQMLAHKCEWDEEEHIEKPERLDAILDLLEKDGVLGECCLLESAKCTNEDLRLVHSQQHIDSIRTASGLPSLDHMEEFCRAHEDIFINQHSFNCAVLSAGCAIKAMESCIQTQEKDDSFTSPSSPPNAFAAIRPPGHHASRDTPCGFCLFNNVAICAKKARAKGLQRVLIIDWDVHAGQGTQYCVEDDPGGILLLSIHRFEHGHYWPELPESGVVHQYANTINMPLNALGYGDPEYAALMHFLVLPLVVHWKPELILVSCGFDAALGDPQGEMELSPAGFGYMTGLLAQMDLPLCLLLEGGYFIESVAQGALSCVRALLKRAPPVEHFCDKLPAPEFLSTLFSVMLAKSTDFPHLFGPICNELNKLRSNALLSPIKLPVDEYSGNRQFCLPAPTRGQYPPRDSAVERAFSQRLAQLLETYEQEQGAISKRLPLDFDFDNNNGIGVVPLLFTTTTTTILLPEDGRLDDEIEFDQQKTMVCRLGSANQFLRVYFYLLLPLHFTLFNVSIAGKKLPLQAGQLIEAVHKLSSCWSSTDEEDSPILANFLEVFDQLKPLFLFHLPLPTY